MIIFKPGDFLLKPKITLYNNIARSGKCKGRLLAELEIYPSPRLTWDFETLGRASCEPNNIGGLFGYLKEPFIGNYFRIDMPYITSKSWGSITNQPRGHFSGIALQAVIGNPKFVGQSFSFCIPNAKFQEENLVGQGTITENLKAKLGSDEWEIGQSSNGRFISVPIDDYWQIYLETRQDALIWLKREHLNIGTFVTTFGHLSRQKKSAKGRPKRRQMILLDEAIHRLGSFSLLLSFANGGYTGPLYVEGFRKDRKRQFSGKFLIYRITPLELLGASWITLESDLTGFLNCFSTFERMGNLPYWKDEFDLILSWYFQAVQPQSTQMGKPLPVVANAIGAALERLCVIILVDEFGIRGLRGFPQRLNRLLEQIGLTQNRGYNDKNFVQTFLNIRNEATHPTVPVNLTFDQKAQYLERAIQWVEETLLWRLGYNGKYRDRTKPHYASTEPRYDLTARDPSW